MIVKTPRMRARLDDHDVDVGQQAFGFFCGMATASAGAKILIVSLNNDPAEVYCNDVAYPITWAQYGTDHTPPQAFFYGHVTINQGLVEGERFPYYVSQLGKVYKGSFACLPESGQDWLACFTTCDSNIDLFNDGSNPMGWYREMRRIVGESDKLFIGTFHMDDAFGYLDNQSIDDSAATGLVHSEYPTTPANSLTPLGYNYAVSFAAPMGLLSDANVRTSFGHDPDRIWFYRNSNLLIQWGDHDTGANEMGWNIDTAVDTRFSLSENLWSTLIVPTQPAALSATSKAWTLTVGDTMFIMPDFISNGTGDATDTANSFIDGTGPTRLLDQAVNSQIDDILSAIDAGSAKYHLMGMQDSWKYLSTPRSKNNAGAQNPIKNLIPTEAEKLFLESGNTPPSLMDNPKTNGTDGTLLLLMSDHHWPHVVKHESPAAGGLLAESFCGVCAATVCYSTIFPNANKIRTGTEFDNSTLLYALANSDAQFTTNNWSFGVTLEHVQEGIQVGLHQVSASSQEGETLYRGRLEPGSNILQPLLTAG